MEFRKTGIPDVLVINPPAPKMDDASAQFVIAHYSLGKGGTLRQVQPFRCRCGLGVRTKLMA